MKLFDYLIVSAGAVIIAALVYFNQSLSSELESIRQDYLVESAAHHKADSINSLYLARIAKDTTTISELHKEVTLVKREIRRINQVIKDNMDSIDAEVPFDSSYAYIQEAYPFGGEKSYPLNGMQVKQFHKLDVKEFWNSLKISNLEFALAKSDSLIKLKNDQILNYDILYSNCETDKALYKSEAAEFRNKYTSTQNKLNKVKLTRNIALGGLAAFIGAELLTIIL